MKEGLLVRWHREEGDQLEAGKLLLEIAFLTFERLDTLSRRVVFGPDSAELRIQGGTA